MRGFQKGITLGGRYSGRALKVCGGGVGWDWVIWCQDWVIWWGGVGGPLDFSVTQVQVYTLL